MSEKLKIETMSKKFKTTVTEYLAKSEEKKNANHAMYRANEVEDFETYFKMKKIVEDLESNYFAHVPTVNVSCYIGWRAYYKTVHKIGKTYFSHGERMTKSRGWSSITEIPEITEEMTNNMIADSYYY